MKKLSDFERKHLLLGLLLMCGSIIFYVLCTDGIGSVSVFRIFFPVFWGLYTVVSVVYVILTSWLKKNDLKDENYEISDSDVSFEESKHKLLLITNILAVVTLVIGYLSSTFKNVSVQYATYQPLGWTLAICVEIAMYVIYLFKEDRPEKEEVKVKSEGVQLISHEEAVHILEEMGYELEAESFEEVEAEGEEDETDAPTAIQEEVKNPKPKVSVKDEVAVIEDSSITPPAVVSRKPKNKQRRTHYKKR